MKDLLKTLGENSLGLSKKKIDRKKIEYNKDVKPLDDNFQANSFPDLFKALRNRNRSVFTKENLTNKILSDTSIGKKTGSEIKLPNKEGKFSFVAATVNTSKFVKTKGSVFSAKELSIIADAFDIKSEAKRWNKDNDGVGRQGLTLPQIYYAKAAEHIGLATEESRTELFEEAKSCKHINNIDIKK